MDCWHFSQPLLTYNHNATPVKQGKLKIFEAGMHFDWNIDCYQILCHCDAFDKSCFTEGKTMFHNLNLSFLFSDSYNLKRMSKELLMILNFYICYFKKIKTCHCDIYDWQRAFFQNILSILSWGTILCFQAKIQWYSSPTEGK